MYDIYNKKYILLQFKIIILGLINKQITVKKTINMLRSHFSHLFKLNKTGRYPIAINFELWNECNMRCTFCRDVKGEIFDYNPKADKGSKIEKGKMPVEMYKNIIEEVKDYLFLSVLYVYGEPLLYKNIYELIKYTNDRKIFTMISTNGMLLNEKNSINLVDSGLNFIKIAISGLTQEVYEISHRNGRIEKILKNLELFSNIINNKKAKLLVMIDWISYPYNEHQQQDAKELTSKLGFSFNVRGGNPEGMNKDIDYEVKKINEPEKSLCHYPWKILTVNWNGDYLPCCEYVIWSGAEPYENFYNNKSILNIWNEDIATNIRNTHTTEGRGAIPVFEKCPRKGLAFKT